MLFRVSRKNSVENRSIAAFRKSHVSVSLISCCFFAAGVACRLVFEMVETRIQIFGIVAVAVCFEALRVRPAAEPPKSIRMLLSASAALLGVLLVRLALEGLPYPLAHFIGWS